METQEVHALAIVHDILLVAGFDELAAVAHRVHAAHLYPCVPGLREVTGLSRQHDLGVPDVHDIAFAVERHIAACEGRRQLRTPCYGDHCFFSKTRGLTRASVQSQVRGCAGSAGGNNFSIVSRRLPRLSNAKGIDQMHCDVSTAPHHIVQSPPHLSAGLFVESPGARQDKDLVLHIVEQKPIDDILARVKAALRVKRREAWPLHFSIRPTTPLSDVNEKRT